MNQILICTAALLFLTSCANPAVSFDGAARQAEPHKATTSKLDRPEMLDFPEIKGKPDAELLQAGSRAVQSLGDIDAMAAMSSVDGVAFYPAYACKANVLSTDLLSAAGISSTLTIDTCHEEDPLKMPVKSWQALLSEIQQSVALTKTNRISLNERMGIGIDTGTSYLVETEFPAATHKIAAYIHLGSAEQGHRDWDEVGFVFKQEGTELKLVAVYQDHFSAI